MKIALFSGNYNNVRDGANLALNKLTDFLLRHGSDVRVFSPTVQVPAFAPSGTLISLPSVPIPGRNEYRLAYLLGQTARTELEQFKPDIVHLSAPDIGNHRARAYANERGIPVVASFHTRFDSYLRYYNLDRLAPKARRIARDFYNGCDIVCVPSRSAGEALRSDGVTSPIKRWGRGIDASLFSPAKRCAKWRRELGVGSDTPILFFVGRLVKEKGLDVLTDTVRLLERRGCNHQLIVAGDGPERATLSKLAPRAIFTGQLTHEALAIAYASSDVYLNPSVTETFGNVTQEAMASGVACVVSDAGGSCDLIHHKHNGLVAKANDPQSHADQVQFLFEDETSRSHYARSARKLTLEQSWDAVLAEMMGHYEHLLQAPAPTFSEHRQAA